MAISTTTDRVQYSGNGVTTSFAFSNRIISASHLVVTLTSAAGVDTVQTITTNYTVTLASDFNSATVTMNIAPASGEKLTIQRVVPLTQESNYEDADDLPGDTLERDFDLTVMRDQQINTSSQLTVRFPGTYFGTVPQMPTTVTGNRYLKTNSAGTAFEFSEIVGTGTVSLPVPVAQGGTGATSESVARSNLGLGDLSTLDTVGTAQIDDAAVTSAKIAPGVVIETLTTGRTYYVRADGNDSNNGLTDSAGGAFLTIQKAINTCYGLNFNGNVVTIQVRAGTFAGFTVNRPMVGAATSGLSIVGDTSVPSNVVISATGSNAITASGGARFVASGFKTTTTTFGHHVQATSGAYVELSSWDFGASASSHVYANNNGDIAIASNYSITGGATIHWFADDRSRIYCVGRTLTITGTPAFSLAFAYFTNCAVMFVNANTFTGSATGPRYVGSTNAVCNTAGGGATYLPGNSSGSVTAGAQYV